MHEFGMVNIKIGTSFHPNGVNSNVKMNYMATQTQNFYVNLGTLHSLTFCANKSFSLRKIVRFCYLIWPRDQKHVCQPVNFTVNWIEMLSNIVYSYSQPTSLCVFCCCCCCLRSAHCMKHCISKKLLTVGIAPPKRMHHSWAAVAVAA